MKNVCDYIVILFLFVCKTTSAQEGVYPASEKLNMKLVYQCGIMCIPTGEIQFHAFRNNQTYYMEAKGYNFKQYDLFYKYLSTNKAVVDMQSNELSYFERKVNQNGALFEETYTFDNDKKLIKSKIIRGEKSKKSDTLSFQQQIFDFLSACNYLRHIPYENMKSGQKLPITILLENQPYLLYIKYLGNEKLKLPDGSQHMSYKISVQVIEGSVFKGGEALTAWVSTQSNRIPLQFEAKILVGSVKAYFDKTNSNLSRL